MITTFEILKYLKKKNIVEQIKPVEIRKSAWFGQKSEDFFYPITLNPYWYAKKLSTSAFKFCRNLPIFFLSTLNTVI